MAFPGHTIPPPGAWCGVRARGSTNQRQIQHMGGAAPAHALTAGWALEAPGCRAAGRADVAGWAPLGGRVPRASDLEAVASLLVGRARLLAMGYAVALVGSCGA